MGGGEGLWRDEPRSHDYRNSFTVDVNFIGDRLGWPSLNLKDQDRISTAGKVLANAERVGAVVARQHLAMRFRELYEVRQLFDVHMTSLFKPTAFISLSAKDISSLKR